MKMLNEQEFRLSNGIYDNDNNPRGGKHLHVKWYKELIYKMDLEPQNILFSSALSSFASSTYFT